MGNLSTQIVASWVKEALTDSEWVLLRHVSIICSVSRTGRPEDDIADFIDEKLHYIAEHLRDDIAECSIDGRIIELEIDDEANPYIRRIASRRQDLLDKLRSIDPYIFEKLCARVLIALGAEARETERTNDGGIDFIATKLKVIPSQLPLPHTCHGIVIGQAKRYKDGANIGEVKLREFVGAALLRRHVLGVNSNLSPLAPTLYAFWTTSDLDPNARKFARSIGVWYMDGPTFAAYAEELGLRDEIMGM